MQKRISTVPVMGATALLVLALAAPTAAVPPQKSQEAFWIGFPDFELGLVILVNQTRAHYCTDEVVAWEEDVIEWIEDYDDWVGDGEPDPRVSPPSRLTRREASPEGIGTISVQTKETGKGAIVQHEMANDVVAEIWPMVPDAPGVSPCTDTDPGDDPFVGAGDFRVNDNDRYASETRAMPGVTGHGPRRGAPLHVAVPHRQPLLRALGRVPGVRDRDVLVRLGRTARTKGQSQRVVVRSRVWDAQRDQTGFDHRPWPVRSAYVTRLLLWGGCGPVRSAPRSPRGSVTLAARQSGSDEGHVPSGHGLAVMRDATRTTPGLPLRLTVIW